MRWLITLSSVIVCMCALAGLSVLPNPCRTDDYTWNYGFPLTRASRNHFEEFTDDITYKIASEYIWAPTQYSDVYPGRLAINLALATVALFGLTAFCLGRWPNSVSFQISLADCFVVVSLACVVLALSQQESDFLTEVTWYSAVFVFCFSFTLGVRAAIKQLGR